MAADSRLSPVLRPGRRRGRPVRSSVFSLAVKTPVVALGIIILTSGVLLGIARNTYTTTYLSTTGVMEWQGESAPGMIIRARVGNASSPRLPTRKAAIWYVSQEGGRHLAPYQLVLPSEDGDTVQIVVRPRAEDIANESGYFSRPGVTRVHLKLPTGRASVLARR